MGIISEYREQKYSCELYHRIQIELHLVLSKSYDQCMKSIGKPQM